MVKKWKILRGLRVMRERAGQEAFVNANKKNTEVHGR